MASADIDRFNSLPIDVRVALIFRAAMPYSVDSTLRRRDEQYRASVLTSLRHPDHSWGDRFILSLSSVREETPAPIPYTYASALAHAVTQARVRLARLALIGINIDGVEPFIERYRYFASDPRPRPPYDRDL